LFLTAKSLAFKFSDDIKICFYAESQWSGKGRYQLVMERKNWTSAEEHCNSMKCRLVIIANATEQQAVEDYLKPLNSQYSQTILSARLCLFPSTRHFTYLLLFLLHVTACDASRVLAIVEASVRTSVRLSVTPLICVKRVQAKITKSLLMGCNKDSTIRTSVLTYGALQMQTTYLLYLLSLSRKIFVPLGEKDSIKQKRKWRVPPKSFYYTAIGISNVKAFADRLKHVVNHNMHWWQAFMSINVNDFKWPWTSKKLVIFLRFSAATHSLRVNCVKTAGDRTRITAHKIFSIKRRF